MTKRRRNRFLDTEEAGEEGNEAPRVKAPAEEMYAHRRAHGRMTRVYGDSKTFSDHRDLTKVDYGDLTVSVDGWDEGDDNGMLEAPLGDDGAPDPSPKPLEALPGGLKVPECRAKRYADSVCFLSRGH
jgi:hypothetical protein